MNPLHGVVLGLTMTAGGWTCAAQAANTLPAPPDAHTRIDLTVADNHIAGKTFYDFHPAAAAVIAPVTASPKAAESRTADSKFFLLNGMQLGMAIFDVELTQRCIASQHCRETNPLMPSSQAGQLGLNLGLAAYSSGISYWLKRRKSKLWWMPPAAGIAAHSVGVATGFEHQ